MFFDLRLWYLRRSMMMHMCFLKEPVWDRPDTPDTCAAVHNIAMDI